MKINRENYEVFFIDYSEGKLERNQVKELFDFLEQNADLKKEFEEFSSLVSLEPENEIFENKESLKIITANTVFSPEAFDNFCIANLEGDLTEKQKSDFEKYKTENAAAEKTFGLFQKTKLIADTAITFENKSSLKHFKLAVNKNNKTRRFIYWVASAAAILFLAFYLWNNQNQPDKLISNVDKHNTVDTNVATIKNQDTIITVIPEKEMIASAVNETRKAQDKKIEKIQSIQKNTIETANEISLPEIKPIEIINMPIISGSAEDLAILADSLEPKTIKKDDEGMSLWAFAKQELKKTVTKSKLPVKANFDDQNNITALAFKTKYFSVEHTFAKK